jgi:hypothetical protein
VASADYAAPLASPAGPALGIAPCWTTQASFRRFLARQIDDMGLWTTALTAAQMASIYNAGQAGKI